MKTPSNNALPFNAIVTATVLRAYCAANDGLPVYDSLDSPSFVLRKARCYFPYMRKRLRGVQADRAAGVILKDVRLQP
ncbi:MULTISPECIES: hypothetical protein [unclassified Serratia (in: enterobacteria)]|uniref:hypothetical protein n=1 Tax=unclassified Serratia (in: enterobacteria) TaxID=2647522 RepID=UPI0012690F9F|nr:MULTISPECIES: hypothetical protein [unclassified Serratia (in: enterobacteria)]